MLGALLLAALLVASATAFLARTESGTRFLADQAERFLPVRFTGIAGSLWGAVRIDRVTLALEPRRVTIDDLALRVDLLPLLFDNRLAVRSAAARAVTVKEGEAAGAGEGGALALPYVPVAVEVARFAIERLDLPGAPPMALSGAASWAGDGVAVRRLAVESDRIDLEVAGTLGNGATPRLAAEVRWRLPDGPWRGQGRLDGPLDSVALEHRLEGPIAGTMTGAVDLGRPAQPVLDVAVALDAFEPGGVSVSRLEGRVRGTLENLEAEAGARIAAPGTAPFQVEINASGPVMGPLTLSRVRSEALGGVQEAEGSVSWREAVSVSLAGEARDVALEALHETLGGRVSGAFRVGYRDGRLEVALPDLAGTLHDRSGSLGLAGEVAGSVRLAGQWPDLSGGLSFHSPELSGFGVFLEAVSGRATLDSGTIAGHVQARRLGGDGPALDDPRLEVAGELDALDWVASWAGGEVRGAVQRQRARTVVDVSGADFDAVGARWALEGGTRAVLDRDRLEVAAFCLRGGDARACVETLRYAAGALTTDGELERVPVQLLAPWLPLRLADGGYVKGGWSVTGGPGDWRGRVRLNALELAYQAEPGQNPVALPDLLASGTVSGERLTMRVAARRDGFSLSGRGTLEPIAPGGSIEGTLSASISDLSPLAVFDQRIESLAGGLIGRLDVSGRASAPRVDGQLRLLDGALGLNDPGVRLSRIDARLDVDQAGRFDLRAHAVQQDASVLLTAAGSEIFGAAREFRAELAGEGLRASHPDWDVRVSPALVLDHAGGRSRLHGRVVVPEAHVRLATLPTTVPGPSPDVEVVGREAGDATGTAPVEMDVEVVLGDAVELEAAALRAELEGALRARLDAQGRTTLRGTLEVTGGELTAQGQVLTIESGSVVYNGPVSRPYIDVRAIREIEDATPPATVGLHIRGDADNLTSSVFSEPPMAETRALSYLVLGRDLDRAAGDDDGNQLVAAAINLGLRRSQSITSDLLRLTGLDELSATAETEDSFAIVAGKRISDDLYVRYTYNTLSAVGEFLVRYELDNRWLLEGRTGEASAMDLMYKLER
ncbi:MAG: translocation/assembly module TamB domain-containing protein [Pseudomonadota bacterium]